MDQKKRITYLDLAKAIGIILMVAGHVIGSLQSIDYKDSMPIIYRYIAAFHMPLFFIISGMLYVITKEAEKPMGTLIKRKAQTLLIPYASFSIVYMAMNVFTILTKPDAIEMADFWRLLIYSVTFRGISVLWFLPALFIGEIVFHWCRQHMDDGVMIGTLLLAGFLMMYFSPFLRWEEWESNFVLMAAGALLHTLMRGILVCLFLLIGYLAAPFFVKREKWSLLELVAGVVLLLVLAPLSQINEAVDLNYMVFCNSFVYVLCACIGSFGVILVCKNVWQFKALLWIGTNSLVIMATHMGFCILLHAIQLSFWINQYVTRAKVIVLYLTMAILITLLEIPVVYVYNHYLYFLIGKKKPQGKDA